MEDFERAQVHAYFRRITSHFVVDRRPSAVLITHLLADRPLFIGAVSRLSTLAAVLPKPKSIDPRALHEISQTVPCRQPGSSVRRYQLSRLNACPWS